MALLILILGGLVLHFNPDWFNGAGTVGDVMVVIGTFLFVIWLGFMVFAGSLVSKAHKETRRW